MSSNEPVPAAGSLASEYEGKAKRVRVRGDGLVEIFFKDDATAGNGKKRGSFAGKGALCCRLSEIFFLHLQSRGIATHFLKRIDERTMLARAVSIVPLEVVVRFVAAGSLVQRIGIDLHTPCEPPILKLYYKRDALGDPLINDDHVWFLKLASNAELALIRSAALSAAQCLRELLVAADIALYDLKFEFGRCADGSLILADEISPDTCRFRDIRNKQVLDKDVFRKDLAELVPTYEEVLRRLDQALPLSPPDCAAAEAAGIHKTSELA
jgi:phosphoribosylaminoimidazole-succinocarboxamide synthase